MEKKGEIEALDVAASDEVLNAQSDAVFKALENRGKPPAAAAAEAAAAEAAAAEAAAATARDKEKEDTILSARKALKEVRKAAGEIRLSEKKRRDIGNPHAKAEEKLWERGLKSTKEEEEEHYAERLKGEADAYSGTREKEDMAGFASRILDELTPLQDPGSELEFDWGKYQIEKTPNGRLRLNGKLYPDLETVAEIIAGEMPSGVDQSAVAIIQKKIPEIGFAATESLDADTYTVKKGDTMMAIARKFYGKDVNLNFALELQKTSLGKVETLKGGRVSLIRPGQVIKLPENFLGKERLS